ncbi:MAG: endonuclease/exonuclease/phosphatase family protein [Myxococcales bacterium]|nr:endonuclease/exonuclease/phosphatase family protein [Myxococcales bacterium]
MIEATAVTWNLHGFVGADGRRDVSRTARVLGVLGADVLGLQEVDCRGAEGTGETRLALLAEATGMHATFGPTLAHEDGGYGNALLTRWPVTSVTRHDVSVEGGEPRGVLCADVRPDGAPVRLIVTHFGLRMKERRRQLAALLALIEAAPGAPLLLMGDFNEWQPRSPLVGALDRALGRAAHVRTFPARFPVLALDRIWVRAPARLLAIERCAGAGARHASDHLPVRARLALPGGARG